MSFYFFGIQYAGVTYAASIASIFPGIGAVLAYFFLKEKMKNERERGLALF